MSLPPSSPGELDRRLDHLVSNATAFARAPAAQKALWLRDVQQRTFDIAGAWVEAACRAKGIAGLPAEGEEWTAGPMIVLRQIRLLVRALEDIARRGAPRLAPEHIRQRPDGRVSVRTLPYDRYDGILHRGVHGETWLAAGVEPGEVRARQAPFYSRHTDGAVSLVLGAGNVASVPALDVLQRMFVEGRVCMLKMSPVNEYLGPLFARAFEPLLSRGHLEIVYGGAEAGSYLCHHPAVADVHVTGSRETHDRIVWGPPGAERDARLERGEPLLRKRITSELGNVSPVIVVPGPYSDAQLSVIAESVAGMMTNNASFNCNAARVLILPRGWPLGDPLIDRLTGVLARVPPRAAYYPGAAEQYVRLIAGHERVRTIGDARGDGLPWTLMLGLTEADRLEDRFDRESFCPVLAAIEAGSSDPVEFLPGAVRVANERLFGTLTAMVYVHPAIEADAALAPRLDTAIHDLRYGVVAINRWSAVAYASCSMPWGAHAGATPADAGSGIGWVHNTLMLDAIEKSVVRGTLAASPRPVWFPTHRRAAALGRRLAAFEASPRWSRLPGIAATALRG